ncbi:tetratricopeptide repeat protein [Myxococcota bacterium]
MTSHPTAQPIPYVPIKSIDKPFERPGENRQERLDKTLARIRKLADDEDAEFEKVMRVAKKAVEDFPDVAELWSFFIEIPDIHDEGEDEVTTKVLDNLNVIGTNGELLDAFLGALYQHDKYDEAKEVVSAFVSSGGDIPKDGYRKIFNLFRECQDYDTAEKYALELLSKHDDPESHEMLARIFALKGDKEKALENAKLAKEKGYDDWESMEWEDDLESLSDDDAFTNLFD